MNINLEDAINSMSRAWAFGMNAASQNYNGASASNPYGQCLVRPDPQYMLGMRYKLNLAREFLREAAERHPEWTVKKIA